MLTPTRELAVQIDDDVQGFGYHAGVSSMAVYGGAPMEPQSRALAAGIPFVVATPGRLMDHMRSGTKFDGLETLVLDEADRMLDMGFWPDVRRIVDALPAKRQTLLFSATMPNEILGFARAIMTDPALIQVGRRGAAARTISHAVEHIPTGEKTDWLAKFLRGAVGAAGPILVFVRTKRGADKLASALASRGIRTAALHADRTQKDRLSAVEGFKSGRIRVLVATDIAARGLDIDGITHVVNYDVPHSAEAYVHRVGRTGRALATGHALTLVSPGEERMLKAVLASHAPPPPAVDRSVGFRSPPAFPPRAPAALPLERAAASRGHGARRGYTAGFGGIVQPTRARPDAGALAAVVSSMLVLAALGGPARPALRASRRSDQLALPHLHRRSRRVLDLRRDARPIGPSVHQPRRSRARSPSSTATGWNTCRRRART